VGGGGAVWEKSIGGRRMRGVRRRRGRKEMGTG